METMAITARIDEEITKHLLLVSDLCTQRNSLLPVFRLPTEALANIFTHGAHDHHEADDPPHIRVPDWVNVSYVCRHWRNVALNCPALWTYHFTVSLRWTEALLARSKRSLLKARIEYKYVYGSSTEAGPWLSDIAKTVLHHAERIQELRIHIPAILFPFISLYAPYLQILEIYAQNHPEGTPAINYENLASLHTLKLTNCAPPLHSLNLSSVATLVLCHVPTPSKLDLAIFVDMLPCMPALTVLHLEHAFSSVLSSGASGVSVFRRTSLPHLTSLFILAQLSTVIPLLSCIDIPLQTRVRLEIIPGDGSSIDDYAQLHPLVAQRFRQSDDPSLFTPTIRSLMVYSSMYNPTFAVGVSERTDCDPLPSKSRFPPRECHVTLMILVRTEQQVAVIDRDRTLSDICRSIPLTHVQTLCAVDPPSSSDFWNRTLGCLPGLQYMKLSDGTMPDLAPLLALPADEPLVTLKGHGTSDQDLIRYPKFVPGLEELELCHIEFGPMDSNCNSYKSLLDALLTREACRPRLAMVHCVGAEEENEPAYFPPIYIPSADEMSFEGYSF